MASELSRFASSVRVPFEQAHQRLDQLLAGLSRESEVPAKYERYVEPPVRHLFQNSGKLLRPLLVLLSARAAGEISPAAAPGLVQAAAAVELLHTASLAHDDMVDSSEERRGAPSLHRSFGSTAAVLVGDLLYARFFREIAALPGAAAPLRLRVLEAFLDVTQKMCEGEILEDQARADGEIPSLDAYLYVTEAKTARLISASCEAGAVLNGADEETAAALRGYGRALGLLFQIADDLADGDAPFPHRDLLVLKAEECRSGARRLLGGLAPSEAAATLGELPAHILSPSRA